jgi:hypothetical protein
MLQSVAHVAALCNNHSAQNGRINVVDGQKGLAVWPALWRPTALRQKRSFPEARLTSNVTANSAPHAGTLPNSVRDQRRIGSTYG